MSIEIPAQRSWFDDPFWCRRDLCDEATEGLEVDHHSGPMCQMRPFSWPDRRVSLGVTRWDARDKVTDPVGVGQMRVDLTFDDQIVANNPRGWDWKVGSAGSLCVTTDEAREIGRQLIAMADHADACAVSTPEAQKHVA